MCALNHVRYIERNTLVLRPSDEITFVKSIGDRCREERTRLGLGQAELAKLIGASQAMVSMLERNVREHPKKLLALAKVLNVSPDWLETGKGTKTPAPEGHSVQETRAASYFHEAPLRGAIAESTETWPFPKVPRERVMALSETDRAHLGGVLLHELKSLEAAQHKQTRRA
ncbi:MAG: helix-turn-helix domain-containing protein [Leptothrix sp. (in: b-proteobacteria)]